MKCCTQDPCDRAIKARGLCSAHYWRWYRLGTPDAPVRAKASPGEPQAALRALIGIDTNECQDFPYGVDAHGYPNLRVDGHLRKASRVALDWSGAPWHPPLGAVVRHYVCDRPLCVNPRHLRWGTQEQNVRDMIDHGRAAWQTRALEPA